MTKLTVASGTCFFFASAGNARPSPSNKTTQTLIECFISPAELASILNTFLRLCHVCGDNKRRGCPTLRDFRRACPAELNGAGGTARIHPLFIVNEPEPVHLDVPPVSVQVPVIVLSCTVPCNVRSFPPTPEAD